MQAWWSPIAFVGEDLTLANSVFSLSDDDTVSAVESQMSAIEETLESFEARLLRLKLTDRTRIAPTESEIDALTRRTSDPLIANVAARLVEKADGEDEDAEVARIALRELHAACTQETAS